MRFVNKVALITAAATGIGRATAQIMAREGATVICIDNHQERLDEAVPALRQGIDTRSPLKLSKLTHLLKIRSHNDRRRYSNSS